MAQKIEATHAWLEAGTRRAPEPDLLLSLNQLSRTVVYQTTQYDHDTISLRGGGTMALLKAQSTETLEFCAREVRLRFLLGPDWAQLTRDVCRRRARSLAACRTRRADRARRSSGSTAMRRPFRFPAVRSRYVGAVRFLCTVQSSLVAVSLPADHGALSRLPSRSHCPPVLTRFSRSQQDLGIRQSMKIAEIMGAKL